MQNGWIFKGRRGGCPFYVYLEDEGAGGIRARLHVGRGAGQVYFININGRCGHICLESYKGDVVLRQLGYFVFPPDQLRIFEPNN